MRETKQVPIEPTNEMIEAGLTAIKSYEKGESSWNLTGQQLVYLMYKDMVSAYKDDSDRLPWKVE